MSGTANAKTSRSIAQSRPTLTPEARENRIISKAMDMAEEQIDNRTASSQVLVHYLKLGTVNAQLEQEKLRRENLLLEAKVEATKKATVSAELYEGALRAFRSYSGYGDVDLDDEEDIF